MRCCVIEWVVPRVLMDHGVFFSIKQFNFKPISRKMATSRKRYTVFPVYLWGLTNRLCEKPTIVALPPHVQKAFNHINRIPSRHSQDFQPPSSVKDDMGLKTMDVIKHPLWIWLHLDWTDVRSVSNRVKDYWHVQLGHPDKSPARQQRFNHHHHIQMHDTKILSTKLHYMDQIIRNVSETELQSNNMNREDGLIFVHLVFPAHHYACIIGSPHYPGGHL